MSLYDPGIDAMLGGEGDGIHQIAVRRPDGGIDTMWIVVDSQTGEGPFPTAVFGHGFGAGNVPNCKPDGTMFFSQVGPVLAEAGYLAVSIYYRNTGMGAPALGSILKRDLFILDTNAMLAAARWARDYHKSGTNKVALLGSSGGAWPATWGITDHPDLTALQQGLDIRTSISMGETANEVANAGHKWQRVTQVDESAYTAGSLGDDADAILTPTGKALVLDLLFTNANALYEANIAALPSCRGGEGVPPACEVSCLVEFFIPSLRRLWACQVETGLVALVKQRLTLRRSSSRCLQEFAYSLWGGNSDSSTHHQ